MSKKKRPPCAGLWNTPMVHVDGSLTTCCLDEGLKNKLGSITESSLLELWHGDKINRWRMAQIQGNFEESGPLCSSCNWKSAGAYPEEKALKWSRQYKQKT